MLKHIKENFRLPQYKKIKYIIKESNNIVTLFFEYEEIINIIKSGQFFLVYVFNHIKEIDIEWIPISISYIDKKNNIIGISIKNIGITTNALYKHVIGDEVGLLGPFGNGFNIDELLNKKILFISGGIGIAPLLPLFDILTYNTIIYGVRSEKDVCFIDQINKVNNSFYVFVDNKINLKKDSLLYIADEEISSRKHDLVITVGPELMMKKVLDLCNKYSVNMLASTERYIKCGRGICGQCIINNKRVCVEGPIFNKDELNKLSDFGNCYHDESGTIKFLR